MSRWKTTGIVEHQFSMDGLRLQLIDVGGESLCCVSVAITLMSRTARREREVGQSLPRRHRGPLHLSSLRIQPGQRIFSSNLSHSIPRPGSG